MSQLLQLRRGTTAQHSTFTGAVGEVTVDTDKDVVVVHDGTTAGGFPLPANSITAVHTAGTIELGHASDTSVTRSAAGVVAVEGVVIPSISSTNTLTNKRITLRRGSQASDAQPSINTDNYDLFDITALATNMTSLTANLSGTPTIGDVLIVRITDDGTPRALTFGTSFASSDNVTLPTTTAGSTSKTLTLGFMWDTTPATDVWRLVGKA